MFVIHCWDAELEMFEVKNNGNLISGLAGTGTTSAQLTAAQVVRCSASHRGPQHGQQVHK